MKACGQCGRTVGDFDVACIGCGHPLPSSAGAPPAAPGISWQPLTSGGGTATPVPTPAQTPPFVSPAGTGYNIPQPVAARAQAPPGISGYNIPQAVPSRTPSQPVNAGGVWPVHNSGAGMPPPPSPNTWRGPVASFHSSAMAAGATDFKPVIPRLDTGIINRAQQLRDQFYDCIEQFCRNHAVVPRLMRSNTYDPSVWVECFAWMPEDPNRTATDRWLVNIKLEPMPFHRFEILPTVTISVGEYVKVYTSVYSLDQGAIDRIMTALMSNDLVAVKKIKLERLRDFSWQFWRPKNEVTAIDKEWFDLVHILVWSGTFALALIAIPGINLVAVPVAFACFIGTVFVTQSRKRKRWQYRNQGKPQQEPRLLNRLDSWHALILDIGQEAAAVQQEVLSELRKGVSSGFVTEPETIWYWGLDGKEEREQLVARFRRAIVFIQLYAYGSDLYVGWDAHINSGTWVEKEVARGRSNGQMVSLRTVVFGHQGYSEYDLFDTNCLLEWVHAIVTRVVRRKMEYYKIDQEIDFKIIRGDRKPDQTDSAKKDDSGGDAGGVIKNLFKRKG